MTAPTSDFLRILTERGFIHQCSDMQGLDALAAKGDVVAYVGYDCTAPSLHVGHLLSIMMLHWLQATGAGKPITLMGGGTTRVGDPSGRDETRKILSIEDINANKDALKGVFAKLLTFGEGKTDAIMPDNAEWLTRLNYIEMLRDIGRHFSVNRMMTMDSVRMRLEREQELMLAQQQVAFENAAYVAEQKCQFDVLIEGPAAGGSAALATTGVTQGGALYAGRCYFQAPQIDSMTYVMSQDPLAPGELVRCTVVDSSGYDLVAQPTTELGRKVQLPVVR